MFTLNRTEIQLLSSFPMASLRETVIRLVSKRKVGISLSVVEDMIDGRDLKASNVTGPFLTISYFDTVHDSSQR